MKQFFAGLLLLAVMLTLIPATKAQASPNVWDGSVASGFASGTGTKEDPFVIKTADQLAYLSKTVNNESSLYTNQYIVLASDIYLNDASDDNWTSGANQWDSIGYYDLSDEAYITPGFCGIFDGNGHTIFGLYPKYEYTSVGLFGYIGATGIVKNLTIAKSEVNGNLGTGAIAGYCEGIIQYCANLGTVYSGGSDVGGIVGCAAPRAVIEYCYNGGNVHGDGYFVGGISGSDGNIYNCYNYGTVFGEKYVGGISGSWSMINSSSMKYCYNIGTVTSSGDYAGAIIGKWNKKGAAPQYCYYLEDSAADGYGTVQNGIGSEGLGSTTADYPNATTALRENELDQKDSYQGFDFEKIWSVTPGDSYPAPVFRRPTYSQTHGWCLTNEWYSYGYKTPYKIPYDRYRETYGFSVGVLFESKVKQIFSNWSGNCFGLSLLSLAHYYGVIDLAPYFNKTASYLYDFGYESIYQTEQGKECFTVDGNEEAIKLIERAMVSQSSVEISECEVFAGDSDFSELLEFLNSDDAKPIMVSIMNGLFGHTMVITTDMKPYKIATGDFAGFYLIPLYDPNSPNNSDLLGSPTIDYERTASVLLVNPTTSEWKYAVNSNVYCSNTYMSLSGKFGYSRTIWYYDISQLDSAYFTEPLNLWHRRIQIQISGSNVQVSDKNGNTLLKIQNNQVESLSDDCLLQIPSDASEETEASYVFYTDRSQLHIASSSAGILAMDREYMAVLNLNDSYSADVDFDQKSLLITSHDSKGIFDVCVQDQQLHAIQITGDNVKDNTVSLTLDGESAVIDADTVKQNLEYDSENLKKKNISVNIKDAKNAEDSDTGEEHDANALLVVLPVGVGVLILLILPITLIFRNLKKKDRNQT